MKNIRISENKDRRYQQGESCFKYLILVFLAACWLCKNTDAGQEIAQQVSAVHVDIGHEDYFVKQQFSDQSKGNAQFAKYPHNDPSCGGEFWCIAGWRL